MWKKGFESNRVGRLRPGVCRTRIVRVVDHPNTAMVDPESHSTNQAGVRLGAVPVVRIGILASPQGNPGARSRAAIARRQASRRGAALDRFPHARERSNLSQESMAVAVWGA
jgi:hypothetical protein